MRACALYSICASCPTLPSGRMCNGDKHLLRGFQGLYYRSPPGVCVCALCLWCVWPLKKTYKFSRTTSQCQRTAAVNVTKLWHRLCQLEEPFHSFSSSMAWLEETVKMDKKVNHLGFIGKRHPLSCGAVKGKKKSWKRITAAGRYYWADAARWRCGVMGWRWC